MIVNLQNDIDIVSMFLNPIPAGGGGGPWDPPDVFGDNLKSIGTEGVQIFLTFLTNSCPSP